MVKATSSPTCPISLDEVKVLYHSLDPYQHDPKQPGITKVDYYNHDQARKFLQKYIDKMEKV